MRLGLRLGMLNKKHRFTFYASISGGAGYEPH
jgi:hypothetical protein